MGGSAGTQVSETGRQMGLRAGSCVSGQQVGKCVILQVGKHVEIMAGRRVGVQVSIHVYVGWVGLWGRVGGWVSQGHI